jgi:hypothetical protein
VKFLLVTPPLLLITLVAALAPTHRAVAQDINLPQLLLGESYSAFSRQEESQIVIRVRDVSSQADACGSGFNLSHLGGGQDGFDFPRPGSGRSSSFELPRSGGNYDFPRPGGMVSYFQLPVNARSPQIVGCLDNQRNILFINIRPQSKPQPVPPVEVTRPTPAPTPSPQPPEPKRDILLPPQPNPNDPPITYTPNRFPNNSTGFPTNYPGIK